MSLENVSTPTQVSEQQESNTDEILFSNGRSVNVKSLRQVMNDIEGQANDEDASGSSVHRHPNISDYTSTNIIESQRRKRPPKQPRYPRYAEFDKRLGSFVRWWKQHPNPSALSEAGFFYTNTDDLVRCFDCGIGLKNFSVGDNPLNEHVKNFPDCQYLKEYLGPEGLVKIKKQVQTSEEKDRRERQLGSSTYRHPEYASYTVRLSSFSGWPQRLLQTPKQLADAGLYYTGIEDNVRCFACDGGLKKWDQQDDPWFEHSRWFPECPYVKQKKGEEYIAVVQSVSAAEIENLQLENGDTTKSITSYNVTGEMERLTLRDSELNTVISEHRSACLEMGFSEKDINTAIELQAKKGNVKPTIEDILDSIQTQKRTELPATTLKNESPTEENVRLRSMVYCAECDKNEANALFLPCTHRKLCLACSQPLTRCPVCDREITRKIKTFLV